jgi:hypothetical protein
VSPQSSLLNCTHDDDDDDDDDVVKQLKKSLEKYNKSDLLSGKSLKRAVMKALLSAPPPFFINSYMCVCPDFNKSD